MTPERWQRIRDVFGDALARNPAERSSFLDLACPNEPELREEVASLIAALETADVFLEVPALAGRLSTEAEGEDEPDDLTGRRIGPYRILGLIGRGGMGAVYRAARADDVYEKVVAVKVVRRGMASAFLSRFRAERRILARLEHPGIAHLIDGGTTDDGRPYFVMEHVEGRPIDQYAQETGLDTAARLRLFLEVCSGVAYAHRNLIVHRDLKPANILVTSEGAPKLLDFGIAKLLDPEDRGPSTATALRPMTLDYASPEQVRGDAITTASDVYSLGVVLYELLTGRRPYRVSPSQPIEAIRVICEHEPERPSAAATRPREDGAPASAAPNPTRGLTTQRLRRELKGDLDNIVLMALRKEPERRYPSVEALSADIRRHLQGRPVAARRATIGYRSGRFLRRNRVAVVSLTALLALAVGSAVNMAAQSARVARERDKAERVAAFLVNLFEVSDPGEARGNTVTAREVLDKGAAKIPEELKDQPEVRAALMATMGEIYTNLGLYDKALPLLEEALKARRDALGSEHVDVAKSLDSLAGALREKGDYGRAEALRREALAMRRRLFGSEHPSVAASVHNLAVVLFVKGDYAGAETSYREALVLHRKLLGNEHLSVAKNLDSLATVLAARGDYAGAEALFREALAMKRKLIGSDHPSVAMSLNNLAAVLAERGEYAGAEVAHREALAVKRKTLGPDHPSVAVALKNIADLLVRKGDPAGAEPLFREALEIQRRKLGDGHPEVAACLAGLGDACRGQRKLTCAEAAYKDALALRRKALPPGHTDIASSLVLLAQLLAETGRSKDAEPLLRDALDLHRKALPEGHPAIAEAESVLGVCLTAARRFDEAEPLLLAGYSVLKNKRGAGSAEARETLERIGRLYEAWGKPERAKEYRAMLVSPGAAGSVETSRP